MICKFTRLPVEAFKYVKTRFFLAAYPTQAWLIAWLAIIMTKNIHSKIAPFNDTILEALFKSSIQWLRQIIINASRIGAVKS